MAQSSNSLLCQIAMALGKDGGHASMSNNQWLQIIAGTRTAMSANQCLQVISGRRDNANAVACLGTITSTSVSSMQHGLEVWLGQLSASDSADPPLSLTNAEKLSLSPSTPVGTEVVIVAGFTLGGASQTGVNRTYVADGTFGGKAKYHSTTGNYWIFWDDEAFAIIQSATFDNTSPQFYLSQDEDTEVVWNNSTWLNVNDEPNTETLTFSDVTDGFAVSGASDDRLNGLWIRNATFNGRGIYVPKYFKSGMTGDAQLAFDGNWAWLVDSGDAILVSTVANTDPWNATWLNNSDSTPASLTLTHPAIQRLVAPGGGALLVSGTGTDDGVYQKSVGQSQGKFYWGKGDSQIYWTSERSRWELEFFGGDPSYYSDSDTPTPLTATNWKNASDDSPASITIALTDPQGGVAVIGGTQGDGIWAKQPVQLNGKDAYSLLGDGDAQFFWDTDHVPGQERWTYGGLGGGDQLYYSLSDTPTPITASNWKSVADDTPASITVSSVSVGELYAGLFVSNDGATNGSSYVSQPFHGRQYYMGLNGGGSNNMHWDTDYNVWTDDVGEWTADNVAFPWQGADAHTSHNGATFARNDIPNERNWEVV